MTFSKLNWPSRTSLAGTVAAMLSLSGLPALAGTVSFSTSAPAPSASDVYNFVDSTNDAGNIMGGDDAGTYVAFDRGAQGQTFLTPSGAHSYSLGAVWLRWVSYDGTYVYLPPGGQFQVRITDPSQSGNAGAVLYTELLPTTGSEPNTLPTTFMGPITGDGTWMRLALDTPVSLNPDTTYGFDVSSPNSLGGYGVQPFFETAGISTDVFASGNAYTSGPNGSGGDNTLTAQTGDRAFLVELTAAPEPTSLALIGVAGVFALFTHRRRK